MGIFLHGNVLAGYCLKDSISGVKGVRCSLCGELFQPSRMLYPIKEKNHYADPMIAADWADMDQALRNAFMVTIFGYSAPASDASAMDLMGEAWGPWQDRQFEQIEIIDVQKEEDLRNNWRRLIHTHHYQAHHSSFDSWLNKRPRRGGEAFWNQHIEGKFIEENPIPRTKSLLSLQKWFEHLLQAERR